MKLAEALLEKSHVQERMEQLRPRLSNNARVQEGEKPAEDPAELMRELSRLTGQLEELTAQINLTNSRTLVNGQPLTLLLAQRDARKKELTMLRDFLDAASHLTGRSSASEIRILSTVDVAAQQKLLDQKSKALRELDASIQAANWTTDL